MNWDWEKLQEKRQRQNPSGPDFSSLGQEFERLKDIKFKLPGGFKLIGLAALAFWVLSGIYIVEPDELGVVKRFGAYLETTGPGPHYHIPFPVESVMLPKVTQIRRAEVGFRTIAGKENSNQTQYRLVPEESLMLTGDENIVDVQFIVQFQINDPVEYLFRVDMPQETVKVAAEAAMREVIGNSKIDSALTTGKLEIQNTTKEHLQTILDTYNCGVTVVAVQLQDVHPPKDVVDAFKDVASAREDKSRMINEAEAYRNDIIPRTRGEAAAILNEAQAYKERVVRGAQGEASRFLALLTEYDKAKEITRDRLFLEAMEQVLANPHMEKIIMSDEALKQTVPYLPLERMNPRQPGKAQEAGGR